jgi:hypothetical protein
MRHAKSPLLFSLVLIVSGVLQPRLVAQENELVREIDRLETSRAEMTEFQEQLERKLRAAKDQGQGGNVEELETAMRRAMERQRDAEIRLSELRAEMEQRERRDLETLERARQEQDRAAAERARRESQRREPGPDAGQRRERDMDPELREAINRLNHMKAALGHLREARLNEMADRLENELRESSGKVERAIKNSRQPQETQNRPTRERARDQDVDRDRQQERERAMEQERDRNRERGGSPERAVAERLDRAIEEFSEGFRLVRNELQELREQVEALKRQKDR